MAEMQRVPLRTQDPPVTIFISYASQEAAQKQELEQFLEQYLAESGQYVRFVSIEGLVPGEKWTPQLRELWQEAEIFLLLVSEKYLGSVRKKPELDLILEHASQEAGVKALPIILEACDWQHSPLARYQALPQFGKPLASFPDKTRAYEEIGDALVTMTYFRRNAAVTKAIEQEKQQRTGALRLVNCGLPFIPRDLLDMPWLQELDLRRNSIRRIENLERLPNLRRLLLSTNELRRTDGLQTLTNLHVLDLQHNNIQELSGLGNLAELQELGLSHNELYSLEGVQMLPTLRVLYAAHNLLEDVEELEWLPNLRRIVLTGNDIRSLRPLLGHLRAGLPIALTYSLRDTEEGIFVKDNPRLNEPAAEVVEKGREAVIKYFEDAEQFGVERLEIVKLVLVGNSGVGKTNFSQFLRGKVLKDTHNSTHLLDIQRFEATFLKTGGGRPMCVNVFDFGGQDYYHDSHRLYYSHDTVYVLLWDERSNRYAEQSETLPGGDTIVYEDFPLAYWLESIRYNLRDKSRPRYHGEAEAPPLDAAPDPEARPAANSAPILVLQNKIDEGEGLLDQQTLVRRYPGIVGFFSVALREKLRTRVLPEVLAGHMRQLDFTGRKLIRYEHKIVRHYLDAPPNAPFRILSLAEFCADCRRLISNDQVAFTPENAQIIAQILNSLGLVYYDKGADAQEDVIFTRVDELNRLIKQVMLVAKQGNDKGFFRREQLSKIPHHEDVLRLLLKNQSIVGISAGQFLAPQFLPARPDAATAFFTAAFTRCQLRYVYEAYFHKTLLLRLFARYVGEASSEAGLSAGSTWPFWRNGLIISRQAGAARQLVLVELRKEAHQGVVEVRTIGEFDPHGLEREVEKTLDELNEGWTVRKEVAVDGENFFDVRQLQQDVARRIYEFAGPVRPAAAGQPALPPKTFSVHQFKHLVAFERTPKKLFISYSSKNADFVRRFTTHLEVLKATGLIDPWYDRMIEPGTRWDDAIRTEMLRADVVIFLLSPDFLATSYIMQTEVPLAIGYHQAGRLELFFVELLACGWEHTPIRDYQQTGDPAQTAKNVLCIEQAGNDTMWKRVMKQLTDKLQA